MKTNSDSDDGEGDKRNPRRIWPAVINVINSYAAYYSRKDKQPNDPLAHRIGFWTRAIAYGTILGAILAGVAAFIFWCQLEDNRQAFIAGNRAYVFSKDIGPKTLVDPHTFIPNEVVFSPVFENSGNTPAFHSTCWDNLGLSDADIGLNRLPAKVFSDIGPHQTTSCPKIHISQADLINIWEKRVSPFIWMRVEYSDAFANTPRRYTEICGAIEVGLDPRLPVDGRLGPPEMINVRVTSPRCNSAN